MFEEFTSIFRSRLSSPGTSRKDFLNAAAPGTPRRSPAWIIFALIPGLLPLAATAATQPAAPLPSLSASQVVQRMVDRNQQRAEALRGYTELRHYTVAYHGFPPLKATMTVEATYAAPSTKTFRIVAKSGPGFLIDAVLKRLLTSEAEAARDPAEASITPANYHFGLIGEGQAEGHPCYILEADPKENSKFLFRGKVWIDGHDFGIVQIEAQPAKNPSFWIRRTEIHHVYARTGEFWLPAQNESRTDVRFGGTADLTINYGIPQVEQTPPETAASGEKSSASTSQARQ